MGHKASADISTSALLFLLADALVYFDGPLSLADALVYLSVPLSLLANGLVYLGGLVCLCLCWQMLWCTWMYRRLSEQEF